MYICGRDARNHVHVYTYIYIYRCILTYMSKLKQLPADGCKHM